MRKLWKIIRNDAEFNIDCGGKKLIEAYRKSFIHHLRCSFKGQKQSCMVI